VATGYEFCQTTCLSFDKCLEICDGLDQLVALIKESVEIGIAVVEHNICLTTHNCP
jgi:hypothetical protein